MNTCPSPPLNAAPPTGEGMRFRLLALALMLVTLGLSESAVAQTPCEDGVAGQYPCAGLDLMCVRSFEELGGVPPGNGNDCWGWTHYGREFVLYGRSDGTSIIEVTDPVNPVMVANVPTASIPSLWRDIKVIGDVAYIVSEAQEHGMQVIDLSGIPDAEPMTPPLTFAHYTGFGRAHNVVANPETGYVYGVGTDTFSGGLHIVDVSNPSNPTLAGSWEALYVHDAQAVVYAGPDEDYVGREMVFALCGYAGVRIVDVDDKTDCFTVANVSDSAWAYTHQGWLSEDHRFLFMNDEIDESTGVAPLTRTWVMDVQDLDNPLVVGYHEGALPVTDHNLYTHEGKVYAANYFAGIQVLDIVDPSTATLEMTAFFDTNPFSDQVGTGGGAWSVYPYFESGNIAISTQSHFFMVRPSGLIDAVEEPTVLESEVVLHPEEGQVRLRSTRAGVARVYDVMGRHQADWPMQAECWSIFRTEGWPAGTYVLKTDWGASEAFLVR